MRIRTFWLVCAVTLFASLAQAQLTINGASSGTLNFGTVGYGIATFSLIPAGGTGPYVFDLTGPAIPDFRIASRPDVPNTLTPASATAALIGLAKTSGTYTSTIRLTDTATSATLSRTVTFIVSDLDVFGVVPSNYGVGDTVSFSFYGIGGSGSYSFAWVSGTLPPGLAFDAFNGVLSGTLTAPQPPTAFGIQVTDGVSKKTFTRSFSPSVSPLRLQPAAVSTPSPRIRPPATQNLVYSDQLVVSGCSGPCTFGIVAGDSLPAGLTMSSSGLISGTPTNITYQQNFTVNISDLASNTVQVRLALIVLPAVPVPLSISPFFTFRDFPAGQDTGGNEIFANGGVPPYTFSVDSLPAGVILRQGYELEPTTDATSAIFRSRSIAAGPFSFMLTVHDSVGNVATFPVNSQIASIAFFYIFLPAFSGPTAVLNVPYSEELVPLGGTPPYTVSQVNTAAGLSVNNAGFVSGTPLESGRFLPFSLVLSDSASHSYLTSGNITVNAPGGATASLNLTSGTFLLSTGSPFALTVGATGSTVQAPNFTVTLVSGSLPPGLKLLTGQDFNGGGAATSSAQIAGIPTTPGTYSVILNVSDGVGGVGQRQITFRVSGLSVVTAAVAFGTVGQPYSQAFDVRGGTLPYTFTSSLLPPGLSINSSTGMITGTPTASTSTTLTISVTDAGNDSFSRSYGLNIYSLEITTPNILPIATAGRAYSQALAINPVGPYTWTAVGLPSGLAIGLNTGVISGTLSNGLNGTFTVTVTAANAATAVVKNFTIFVQSLNLKTTLTGLPTSSLGEVVVGSEVTTILGVAGGTPPYTIALDSGILPPGLSLVPATQVIPTANFGRYAIAGVPTTAGVYSFRLRYMDFAGLSAVRTVNFTVRNIGLATGSPGLATVNQPYSAQLMGVGAPGPFTFALAPAFLPPLPPGLTLSPTGLLSGVPTSTGSFAFNVNLTAGAETRLQTVVVTVEAAGTRFITVALGPVLTDIPLGVNVATLLTPINGAGTHTWSIVSGALPPGLQLLSGVNLPAGFGFPPTAALLKGAPSVAGDYTFRIRVDDSTGNFGIRDVTVHVTPLRNGPLNQLYSLGVVAPPMRVGTSYSHKILMLNEKDPVTFVDHVGGTFMPAGVSMDATGAVSGTVSDAGNFLQLFLATDANSATKLSIQSFTSYPAAGPIGVNGLISAGLGDATVGTAYSFNLNDLLNPGYGVAPFVWTVDSGALPANVAISGNVLTGTPTAVGFSIFTLLVTDAQGTQHLVGPIGLNVSNLSIGPASLPPAAAGSPYGALFSATGVPGPFTFRTAYFSDMPAGLSLTANGALIGTPTTQGPFQLWIEAVDTSGDVVRKRYVLTVGPPGIPLPSISATPSNVAVSYTIGNPAPTPIPISIGSTSTAFGYTVSASTASGVPWLTVSPSSGLTPGTINASFTVAGLPVGTHDGAITVTAPAATNTPLVIPVTLTVAATAVCNYSLSATSTTIPAAGGPAGFDVNTSAGCNWAATSPDPWITVNTPSGTGPGTVSLAAAANSGSTPRTGSVTVQGLTFTVTEFGSSCAFSISPSSITVNAGTTSLPVSVNASDASCGWGALGVSPVSISGPAAGTGSGSVTVAITANAGGSRIGTATIAGNTFTVNQGGVGCSFALSAGGALLSWAGGPASFDVIAPGGCSWATDSGPAWVKVASGQSGSGNGTVSLNIDPNSSVAARTTPVLVGGQSFLISQAGAPCGFSISANNPVQPVGGGGGSVNITASAAACSWVASSNAGWVTLTTVTGIGSGSASFTVVANPGAAARSAVVTVAGQDIIVNQNGATCSYTLQSPSANVPSGGGPGVLGVVAAGGCPWTASSTVPWVQITSGASSSGPGDIGYSVDGNTTGSTRSGTLTIAGISFPVTQAAASCIITLGSSSFAAGEFGGSSSFTYTTSVSNCNHTVQSSSSWLTASRSYSGTNGTVNFTVAPNSYSAARSAVIRVGDQEFTVTQAPSTCAYTLTSFGASFPRLGGDGAVPMNFAPAACGPPAVLVAPGSPPGMITLGPVTPGSGTYTQNYVISVYETFINYVRTGQLLVQGQVYTVKQNSF